MASKGADVILGCRDEKKGKSAAESISKTVKGDSKVQYRVLDLFDFRSIRNFASGIDHCDILINNAGRSNVSKTRTSFIWKQYHREDYADKLSGTLLFDHETSAAST